MVMTCPDESATCWNLSQFLFLSILDLLGSYLNTKILFSDEKTKLTCDNLGGTEGLWGIEKANLKGPTLSDASHISEMSQ